MSTKSFKSTIYWRRCAALSILLAIPNFACEDPQADPGKSMVRELPASQVILGYEGGQITAKDLHEQMAPALERLKEEAISLYHREAEALAISRILEVKAHENGFKSTSEYREALQAKVLISDSTVLDFIKRNHLPANSKKEEIKKFLLVQSGINQENEIRKNILKEAKIEWKISSAHYEFKNLSILPPIGQSNAAVVIQEFCDFGNSLCAPIRLGIKQLLLKYPKEVLIYFHPLLNKERPGSQESTLAVFCAAQQGKFWEMSGELFDHEAKITSAGIQQIANSLKLDSKIFQSCLTEPKTTALAQDEIEFARSHGIRETPAYYVNGEKANSLDELNQQVEKLIHQLKK